MGYLLPLTPASLSECSRLRGLSALGCTAAYRSAAPETTFAVFSDPDAADASAAQKGDEEAFARLVRRHRKGLMNLLRRFTRNETDIQDLMQETYLEVYRSLPTYRRLGPFSCWLRRIASRVGYRHWSGQARQVRARAAFLELQRCEASQSVSYDEAEYIQTLLNGFGRRDGQLLELRYVQGLSPTEIARTMGWKAERVRVRLHRALAKLRLTHDRAEPDRML